MNVRVMGPPAPGGSELHPLIDTGRQQLDVYCVEVTLPGGLRLRLEEAGGGGLEIEPVGASGIGIEGRTHGGVVIVPRVRR